MAGPMRDGSLRSVAALVVLATAVFTTRGLAGPAANDGTERGLCPFPLEVSVKTSGGGVPTSILHFVFAGRARVTLRNASTGREAVLESQGSHSVDTRSGTLTFRGHHVWYWSTGNQSRSWRPTGRAV